MIEEMNEYDELLFDVRRSVRYHVRRRHHFETIHKFVLFIALVFGSATVAVFADIIGEHWPLWVKSLPAGLVSVLAAFDLVINSTTKAWLHADLARQFIDLERHLELEKDKPHDDLVKEATDQRLQIEATEPRALRVLDTLCYNEMLRAMGYEKKRQIKVTFIQRICAPFFDFHEERLHLNET